MMVWSLCEMRLIVDCVCSATLHPGWGMMATGSGSHHFGGEQESKDFSMKIWVFEEAGIQKHEIPSMASSGDIYF